MNNSRTLNYVTFAVLMVSTALGYQLFWGILFLFWTILSFRSGNAFLLTSVARKTDPFLFWVIQVAWVTLGLIMVAGDFPSLK